MSLKKTAKQFVKEAHNIHGKLYDYSLIEYKDNKTKIKIICPVHGVFEQKPNTHLNPKNIHGCPKCGVNTRTEKKRKTTKEVLLQLSKIYPSYNLSKIKRYKNNKTLLDIECPMHGWFKKSVNSLLTKAGCPKCGRIKAARALSLTKKEFIKRSSALHKNKYDYSLLVYKNKASKVKIVCPVHGVFEQIAGNHLSGEGCKRCAAEKEGLRKRNLIEPVLIDQFRKIHGNIFDYSQVKYKGSDVKVKIICKKHGAFWQSPAHHKRGVSCPGCRQSKGEREVRSFLEGSNIEFIHNKRFYGCKDKLPLPFDFYLPQKNVCIEYDGELHYKRYENSFKGSYKLETTKKHDKMKNDYCKKMDIPLIRIPYWKKNKIKETLSKALGKNL